MGDLVGSADWIELGHNFYTILGDNPLAHFHDYATQAAPEDNLKLYAVLGSRAGSLRAKTELSQFWAVEKGH